MLVIAIDVIVIRVMAPQAVIVGPDPQSVLVFYAVKSIMTMLVPYVMGATPDTMSK
jgi:hypothetical protein